MTGESISATDNALPEIDVWLEEFLTGLLDRTGLDIWVAEMDIDANTRTWTVQLDGADKSRAIGRDGQMIDSIQHLCIAAAANRGVQDARIVIDVDGYRSRRDSKLADDVTQLAREVLETGVTRSLEPMDARDRRMVHMIASRMDGIVSESYGQGRDRHVRLSRRS